MACHWLIPPVYSKKYLKITKLQGKDKDKVEQHESGMYRVIVTRIQEILINSACKRKKNIPEARHLLAIISCKLNYSESYSCTVPVLKVSSHTVEKM